MINAFRNAVYSGMILPLLIATPALAQTAPPNSQPPQQPSLQEQLDGVAGKIAGAVSDLRSAVILYANQAAAFHQQLAEANQTIALKVVAINDLTKDRDATKASLTAAEKQVADDKAVVAEQGGRIATMTTDIAARDKTIADLKASASGNVEPSGEK